MDFEEKYGFTPETDGEMQGFEYTIPDGFTAEIKDGKVIVKKQESEDERIRKELIFFLKEEIPQCSIKEHADKLKEFVSYLEKQKDEVQKQFNLGMQAGREEALYEIEKQKELTREAVIKQLEKEFYACCTTPKWFHDTIQNAINHTRAEILGDFNSPPVVCEEKQKEPHYAKRNALFDKCVQNCDPEVMKSVSDKIDEMMEKEQKPAKLNDDIEVGLDRALQIVKAAKGNLCGYQSDDGIYECCHAIQTLERILKNGIEQKPVEWDEEDDQYLLICENALAKYCRSEQWSYPIVSKWLEEHCKVLSQPRWKPSEEQMKALNEVANNGVLLDLFNDLLKLL